MAAGVLDAAGSKASTIRDSAVQTRVAGAFVILPNLIVKHTINKQRQWPGSSPQDLAAASGSGMSCFACPGCDDLGQPVSRLA